MPVRRTLILSMVFLLFATWTTAADPPTSRPSPVDGEQEQRFRKFGQDFSGVTLVGRFTVSDMPNAEPKEERYTITRVVKTGTGDFWLFAVRIKYGETDASQVIPLEVKWAGDTPVISLTNFSIPGLGTFSARVVLYDNMYAGTWRHGKKSGHLFGHIEQNQPGKAGQPASR